MLACRKLLMEAIPVVVSMLVYIDLVSAVKTRAFFGVNIFDVLYK